MKKIRLLSYVVLCYILSFFILSSCELKISLDFIEQVNYDTDTQITTASNTESNSPEQPDLVIPDTQITTASNTESNPPEQPDLVVPDTQTTVESGIESSSIDQPDFEEPELNKLLVIESIDGESDNLCTILGDSKKITVVNSYDTAKMPKTIDELCDYDEIIMVNVANADLPDGFDKILYRYVKEIGGSLFTVCGNKEDGNPNDNLFEANAFTEADMGNSLYQELLPVDIIEYTPPVAVMIIFDTSGSMYNSGVPYETTKLYAAQQGALTCLQALTERDWVGVMTFADQSAQALELTPRTDRIKIEYAINNLPKNGGNTKFTHAINDAGDVLAAFSAVERRHIILVTDGQPSDDEEDYGAAMKKNADRGITMSIVGIEVDNKTKEKMELALEYYAGMPASHFHNVKGLGNVGAAMRDDLDLPEIKAVNYETFVPTIKSQSNIVDGIDQADMPSLDGYYGTKLKADATEILGGEFVPIYAQWEYGKGMVGSFLCDLNGKWSSEFIASETGKQLIINMIDALLPTEKFSL